MTRSTQTDRMQLITQRHAKLAGLLKKKKLTAWKLATALRGKDLTKPIKKDPNYWRLRQLFMHLSKVLIDQTLLNVRLVRDEIAPFFEVEPSTIYVRLLEDETNIDDVVDKTLLEPRKKNTKTIATTETAPTSAGKSKTTRIPREQREAHLPIVVERIAFLMEVGHFASNMDVAKKVHRSAVKQRKEADMLSRIRAQERMLTQQRAKRLAPALGCSVQYLMGGTPTIKDRRHLSWAARALRYRHACPRACFCGSSEHQRQRLDDCAEVHETRCEEGGAYGYGDLPTRDRRTAHRRQGGADQWRVLRH